MEALNALKDQLGFDPEELRRRYIAERDRRIRADNTRQYVDMYDKFSDMAIDPYVEPGFERDAIDREVEAVILGGGLAGITAGVALVERGITDFLIVDEAGDFGGAWYWNQYPGIRCDVESYIYFPLLEEVGTVPSERYAPGHEIRAHCRALADKFGLYDRALFQTPVTVARWDEESSRWIISTARGDTLRAKHLLASNGPLHRPKVPNIPGITDFAGAVFHTSRWDYSYSGGDSTGGLTGLADKRVALVGTGATSIQVLPHLAESAKHVYVVQRTPSVVSPRNNRKTDREWYESQEPGWQEERQTNFFLTMAGVQQPVDLVNDSWTALAKVFTGDIPELTTAIDASARAKLSPLELMQLADFVTMERVRSEVDRIVEDPETAEKLKPWFNLFCKRPTFSDDYLQSFNGPNVTLVDTNGKGLSSVTENSIIYDGEEFEVDAIIFATGFEADAEVQDSGRYELIGRNGVTLHEMWASGRRTVHGTKVSGLPNFQILGAFQQAAITFNYPHVMTMQCRHAAKVIAQCLSAGTNLDVSTEQESDWRAELDRVAADPSQVLIECTPSYLNNEGDVTRAPIWETAYAAGALEYAAQLDQWVEDLERTQAST